MHGVGQRRREQPQSRLVQAQLQAEAHRGAAQCMPHCAAVCASASWPPAHPQARRCAPEHDCGPDHAALHHARAGAGVGGFVAHNAAAAVKAAAHAAVARALLPLGCALVHRQQLATRLAPPQVHHLAVCKRWGNRARKSGSSASGVESGDASGSWRCSPLAQRAAAIRRRNPRKRFQSQQAVQRWRRAASGAASSNERVQRPAGRTSSFACATASSTRPASSTRGRPAWLPILFASPSTPSAATGWWTAMYC